MSEQLKPEEKAGLRKHGWYAHMHTDLDENGLVNFHTHGLASKFSGALDLQIVRPMNHVLANLLFWEFADRLTASGKIKTGDKYDLPNFEMIVATAFAAEGGRIVCRIILPDLDGWLFPDQMDKEYAKQWIRPDLLYPQEGPR